MPNPTLISLDAATARQALLHPESYCSIELPPYIDFSSILTDTAAILSQQKLSSLSSRPFDHEGVNYRLVSNKDGRFAWRPFEIVHPALYVDLVDTITEASNWAQIQQRFSEFSKDGRISCLSIPTVVPPNTRRKGAQVREWWQEVEQRSLELSIQYDHMTETDITDCYGSIYTHSIAWAMHGKKIAKSKKADSSLLGNVIDARIRDMRHGQTNGIPQGSTLMDLIAEMVLGFIDMELIRMLGRQHADIRILRYRDDYRIFTHSAMSGEAVTKAITEVCQDLGLKLNPIKTRGNSDVVRSAVKPDKIAWTCRRQFSKNFQKHLLILHDHAMQFPNCGSLVTALGNFHRRIAKLKQASATNYIPMIGIVVDIAYRNPRTYPVCAAILSTLITLTDGADNRKRIVDHIREKFNRLPNTGHMQIWLQRITLPQDRTMQFTEALCDIVTGKPGNLWNHAWISSHALKKAMKASRVVDIKKRDTLPITIQPGEVEIFPTYAQ
jgi:RNA-directed DNA polymerase